MNEVKMNMNHKKIGICACYDTRNYGSMLQALATQIKIEKLGYESEFIVYKKKKDLLFILKQIPRVLNKNLINDKILKLRKKMIMKKHPVVMEKENVREKYFSNFKQEYYHSFSDVNYGYNELKRNASQYKAVVVGSDQLWTPGGLGSNFYNLMFVPDDVKKISYATSFGVSDIPWYQIKRTKEYLKRINYLSVREVSGAKIIEKYAGKKAKVVCDPTLLLTCEEWKEMIPEKRLIEESYIFCYFLGENKKHRDIANELKEKTGLKIVTTPFLDSFVKEDLNFGDEMRFDVGPNDFVNLIRGAEYILTDSFHGSVFSILNKKQFIILNRYDDNSSNSRNSRIDSFCTLLGVEDRRYKKDIYESMIKPINYELVKVKEELFRQESVLYLEQALKGI